MLDFLDILDNYAMWGREWGVCSAPAMWWAVLVVLVLGVGQSLDLTSAATSMCTPTRPDSLGPFYEPNAPERDSTGQGLIISGIVRSARDCHALGEPGLSGGLQTRMATMMPHIVPHSRPAPTVPITLRTSRDAIDRPPAPPCTRHRTGTPYAGHTGLSSAGTDSHQCGSRSYA